MIQEEVLDTRSCVNEVTMLSSFSHATDAALARPSPSVPAGSQGCGGSISSLGAWWFDSMHNAVTTIHRASIG